MSTRPIPTEVLAATKGARTVVAPTDDGRDDAYRQGHAAAIALCAAHKAKLILVDRATESWWIDPYGSGPVTADTDLYSHGERPLDRGEVAALGHGDLVQQMDEAAAAGVEVEVWLAGPSPPIPQPARSAGAFPGRCRVCRRLAGVSGQGRTA